MLNPKDMVQQWAWLAIIAVPLAIVYGFVVSPYPLLEDDALFILASHYAGVAHSPGYPAYVLLTQVTRLFPGPVALQVHLFNVLLAIGLCCGLGVWLRRELECPASIAIATSLCLGVSALFLGQATIAEVYMLNCALFLCLLAFAYRISRRAIDNRSIALFAFGVGISLSNHWPLTILLGPSYLAILWPQLRELLARWYILAAGLVLGLTPYLWMYWRSGDAAFSHMGAFGSISDFVYFVSRAVYVETDQNPLSDWHDKVLFAKFLGAELLTQFSALATVSGIAGFIVQRRYLPARLCLALIWCLALPVLLSAFLGFTYTRLQMESMRVYPLTLYLVFAIWIALGLRFSFERLHQQLPHMNKAIIVIGVMLVVTTADWDRIRAYERESTWAIFHANAALKSMPENANAFVMDDWLMGVVSYAHMIDGVRPDITLYSEYATFLPTRLFQYFDTSPEEKREGVTVFMRASTQPVVVMQGPEHYLWQWQDAGYYYNISVKDHGNEKVPTLPVASLAIEPVDPWINQHWRYLLLRWQDIADVIECADLESNFVANIDKADQLMKADSVDAAAVAAALDAATAKVETRDLIDRSRLLFLRGKFLQGLAQYDASTEQFLNAIATYPVKYNPAIGNLARNYVRSCDISALTMLADRFALPLDLAEARANCPKASQ